MKLGPSRWSTPSKRTSWRPTTSCWPGASATSRCTFSASTSKAPARAPRTEPTPPLTMTTKGVIRMRSPMPISPASSGAARRT
ncbi:hypothetical protein G6F24_018828 [Rhizopus arrhizus]|nr:hypothetical protein G6F24_018828 [Rhizopus arrhizus]